MLLKYLYLIQEESFFAKSSVQFWA